MTRGFPNHVAEALGSYKTPGLPAGFTDRLVEKALSQSNAAQDAVGARSGVRRNSRWTNPWKRGGYIASSVVGFGLVSAAAAAALSLAEIPVRIPVMSDLVEQVLPVKPAAARRTDPVVVQKSPQTPETGIEAADTAALDEAKPWREMNRLEKRDLIRERVAANEEKLQKSRAERGLPLLTDTQLRRRRAAIRRAIVNRNIRRPVLRQAVRRAAIQKRLENRRATVDPLSTSATPGPISNIRSGTGDNQSPDALPLISPQEQQTNITEQSPGLNAQSSVPVPDASVSIPDSELPTVAAENSALQVANRELQAKLPEGAAKRLQQASPAERRQMLRELRNRRNKARKIRSTRQKLRAIRKHRK